MSHEIEIEGCLTVPDKISLDDGTASTAISFPIWWR